MQHNSSSKFTNPVIDNLEEKHAPGRKCVESQPQHFRQSPNSCYHFFPRHSSSKEHQPAPCSDGWDSKADILDSEKTLQEREFQRYTTQDAQLVDNPEGKERILQRISSCPDPAVWFTCKLFVSKNHKNLQLGAILSSFKKHILEKSEQIKSAEQIQLLRQFRIKSFIKDKDFSSSTKILNIWCNKSLKPSKEIL